MNRTSHPTKPHSAGLLSIFASKRFGPFFWTQALGAFNDNVYKNSLSILIAFQFSNGSAATSHKLVNLAAGLLVLPFFLFSAFAGQISDKYDKAMLIRWIKAAEIVIMVCACIAFYLNSITLLMIILFLMGTQSAFFGPIKYSIIPQHLEVEEVMAGNALVSMGTFLAILTGTMLGGILIQYGETYVGIGIILAAIAGYWASLGIPAAPSPTPDLEISPNPFTQLWRTVGYTRRVHSVFLSILGISWFWFLGSCYLTQIPNFTKLVLQGNESVVTLLLTVFALSIGCGSILCEKISGGKIELGLVPIGSIGLSLFGIDLFLACRTPDVVGLIDWKYFLLHSEGSWRVMADLALIGLFGGFYIVPLNAFVQTWTEPAFRARVIAGGNILNAFFMVLASVVGMILLGKMASTIPQFFMVIAVANIGVALYIYTVVPEFTIRFLIWMLTHTMYRVRSEGMAVIPDEGPVVLVCNHVSYVDGLIISSACRRPVRFVVHEAVYRAPVLNFIFRNGKAIPINSQKKKPEIYKRAFEEIAKALDEGQPVCIFPEGKLTDDGEVDEFKKGIERIVARNPVPVIPMALRGLWGSFFSNRGGGAPMKARPSRFWSRVELVAGEPVPPAEVTAEGLREKVMALRGDAK